MNRANFLSFSLASVAALFAPKRTEATPKTALVLETFTKGQSAPVIEVKRNGGYVPLTSALHPDNPHGGALSEVTPEQREAINQVMECTLWVRDHPGTRTASLYWDGPLNGWTGCAPENYCIAALVLNPSAKYQNAIPGAANGLARFVLNDLAVNTAQESVDGTYFIGTLAEDIAGPLPFRWQHPLPPPTPT